MGNPHSHPSDPIYALCLAMLRQAMKDALNGHGVEALDWLYTLTGQETLMRLLQCSSGAALDHADRVVATIEEMDHDERQEIRAMISWRRGDELMEVFDAD